MGTSYIAEALDTLPGVAALHEGHRRNDDGSDILPMVNIKQLTAYKSIEGADSVVADLRGLEAINTASELTASPIVIDVAYYNSVLARALLDFHPTLKMVAIIRDCESFVRSATWIEGTDPMPVGWPDPGKTLDAREKFISLGRIRPWSGADEKHWKSWGAIQRNIWLWKETNSILLKAMSGRRERCLVLDFKFLVADADGTMRRIAAWLAPDALQRAKEDGEWPSPDDTGKSRNERRGSYQVGPSSEWTNDEKEMLRSAEAEVQMLLEESGGFD